MVKNLYLTIFFALLCIPKIALCQQKIGIDWHVPDQSQKAESELQQFQKSGASYLQINNPLSDETWQEIEKNGFSVYGLLPIRFPVHQTIARIDSTLPDSIQALWLQFNAQTSVKAIGIFSYGAETNIRFRQKLADFVNKLRKKTSKPLYYVSPRSGSTQIDSLFDFKITSVSGGNEIASQNPKNTFLYRPNTEEKWSLEAVKDMLEHTAQNPDQPVFFPSFWLQKVLKKYPDFAQTLALQAQSSEPAFALPRQNKDSTSTHSIITFMLILLWIIFAAIYNFSPVYRKSFNRYFTGHSFYVEDVMRRHIRELSPGISIFMQNSIAGGIVIYCLFSTLFTSLGYQALVFHYPFFNLFGTEKTAYFWEGFMLIFLVQIVMILWLWLANFTTASFAQILNLYPWTLQLNLFVATLTAAVFLAGGYSTLIYLFALVFVVLLNIGFLMSCFDMGRYIMKRRLLYFTGTIGLYLIFLAGFVGWYFISPMFQNVLRLSVSLP